MPSDFFDRLVQDRRDGIAPPQVAQLKEAQIAPPPPPLEVEYDYAVEQGYDESWSDLAGRLATSAMECQRCGALTRSPDRHTSWHRLIGA